MKKCPRCRDVRVGRYIWPAGALPPNGIWRYVCLNCGWASPHPGPEYVVRRDGHNFPVVTYDESKRISPGQP